MSLKNDIKIMDKITKVMQTFPKLTYYGYGIQKDDRAIEDKETVDMIFHNNRKALFNDIADFEKVCNWLELINKTKKINVNNTSHWLRNLAAKDIGIVSTGIFIIAAVHCGFRFSVYRQGPDVRFNMAQHSITKIWNRWKRW